MGNQQSKQKGSSSTDYGYLKTYQQLINMGCTEKFALLAAQKYPKNINKALDWIEKQTAKTEEIKEENEQPEGVQTGYNENEEKKNQKYVYQKSEEVQESEMFQAGFVKMTQGNAYSKVYWAVFKGNELHLHDNEAKWKEPVEIIYLTTCVVKEHEEKQQYIVLNDICTDIDYKFEPIAVDDKPQTWIIERIVAFKYFLEDCIVDVLCQDVTQMNARQQFNQFLWCQRHLARVKTEQLPKFKDAVKTAEGVDDELKDITEWLDKQNMDTSDREKFESALFIRNKFWGLLMDTRDFINNDYINAVKICGVFERWSEMSANTKELTENDKKVLVWGLTALSKFTEQEKMDQAEKLRNNWMQLEKDIMECQKELQELKLKWDGAKKKVSKSLGWVLAIGGAVAAIVIAIAAIYAAPVIIAGAAAAGVAIKATAVSVSGVAVAKAMIGGGVAAAPAYLGKVGAITVATAYVGGGAVAAAVLKNDRKYRERMGKIDHVHKQLDCYKEPTRKAAIMMQDWKETISLLEVPLWNIGLGGNDYESEINGWEQINERQKGLLKTAADTFRKFTDQSKGFLKDIKEIQNKLQ